MALEGGGAFLPLMVCEVHPCPAVGGPESGGVGEAWARRASHRGVAWRPGEGLRPR